MNRFRPPPLMPKPGHRVSLVERARVLFSYTAENEDELSIEPGQVINIRSKSLDDSGWWRGELNGNVGVFPDNFVELLPEDVASKPKKPPPPSLSGQRTSSTDAGKPHIKEVQAVTHCVLTEEKPTKPANVQHHIGKAPIPPPVGKKPVRRNDSALSQTDDDKAIQGHGELAENGVEATDKPTAQVKGRVAHHSPSADNIREQPEEGEMRLPDEAGEHDVPCLPPKGLLPSGEYRRAQRLGRQDRTSHRTPSDDDVSPTEAPTGPKNEPKHPSSGHRTSRLPPPVPKEPPTTTAPKSPRSPTSRNTILSPPEHPTSASADATRTTDVAGAAHSSVVEDLRSEVERLKATSVSSEQHEALRQDVTRLRDEFAALKSKMSARISELMDEVDDEKKVRMTMQVEIERIRKLTKHT